MTNWDIIDDYFNNNKYYFTKHHLDSYNDFVRTKISHVITSANRQFVMQKDNLEINVKIGGDNGEGIYFEKPLYNEKPLYPNIARLHNLTYASKILVDIKIEYKVNNIILEPIEFEKHYIGSIPIMLHSTLCMLEDTSTDEMITMGECPYDQGGYFIIDGKEKVIISQERIAPNQLFVTKSSDPLYKYEAKIVSTAKNDVFPKSVRLFVNEKSNYVNNHEDDEDSEDSHYTPKKQPETPTQLKKIFKSYELEDSIIIHVPNITNANKPVDIPLFVLFRAFGIESDKDILKHIFHDLEDKRNHKGIQFIRKSIINSNFIFSQHDALHFLSKFTEYKNVTYVTHVLLNDVFANVQCDDTSIYNVLKMKALYLGYIVRKLINTSLGLIEENDRDNYMYKRVDVTGVLLSNIFKDFYANLRRDFMTKCHVYYDKHFNSNSSIDKLHTIKYMITDNINNYCSNKFINEGITKSFKGNWGLLNNEPGSKEGIVQDLNRLSFLGYVSHVRRVNAPMDRDLKIVGPHRLGTSQWGYMCPIESPDGGNIGLLKHMSVTCNISSHFDESDLHDTLKELDTDMFDFNKYIDLSKIHNSTKVLLNNNWVGTHVNPNKLYTEFLNKRRLGQIYIYASISWNVFEHEIKIFCDSGRCMRPLYIVDNYVKIIEHDNFQKLNFTETQNNKLEHIYKNSIQDSPSKIAKSLNLDGDKELGVARVNRWFDYRKKQDQNKKNILWNSDTIKGLTNTKSGNKNTFENSIIEFVDVHESNTRYIAMYEEDIKHDAHTHLELHPSLSLSLYTNTIPFANHNQAPRNIFSGQQGKQAIGVYATNFNSRIDTASYILHYPQKPLISTKLSTYVHKDKLPNGENLIVAISTYTGYNQEDSIIINENSIARGMFNVSLFKSHVDKEDINEEFNESVLFDNPVNMFKKGENIMYKKAHWNNIDDNGYPIKNTKMEDGDVFLGKVHKKNIKFESSTIFRKEQDKIEYIDKSVVADKIVYGTIDSSYVYNKNNAKNIKIKFRKMRKPVLGDKLASMHGQKGVVGMVIPQENMPFNKDGLVPDIIINPHAIPSRMTISHLLECVLSKLCCVSGTYIDGTVFEKHDFEHYYDVLENNGFQRNANEILYNGFTGEQMNTEIFIGPTYYYRLKHMVQDKINYRSDGPVTSTTKQPTQGRASGGGLRIGEMETNAILAHGIGSFIKESLMERSDKYDVFVDHISGDIAISNKQKKYYKSSDNTNNTINFSRIEIPYSVKLLGQEINSLGLNMKIMTNDDVAQEIKSEMGSHIEY